MLNLILKIIISPIVFLIGAALLTNVNYPFTYQPIVIGVTLAVAGHLLEWAILSRGTFWISLAADFVTSAIIIYILSYFFVGADVTLFGAIVAALFLTAVEFFMHMWLIRSGRAVKEAKL